MSKASFKVYYADRKNLCTYDKNGDLTSSTVDARWSRHRFDKDPSVQVCQKGEVPNLPGAEKAETEAETEVETVVEEILAMDEAPNDADTVLVPASEAAEALASLTPDELSTVFEESVDVDDDLATVDREDSK